MTSPITHLKRFMIIKAPIKGHMAFHICTGLDDLWVPIHEDYKAKSLICQMEQYLQINHRVIRVVSSTIRNKCGPSSDYELICEAAAPENATFKTIAEIQDAVAAGKQVYWKTPSYPVSGARGKELVRFIGDDCPIGLTNQAGNILNGNIEDFHVLEEEVPA